MSGRWSLGGSGGRQFWLDGLGIHGQACGGGVRHNGMFVRHLRRFQYLTGQVSPLKFFLIFLFTSNQ